MMRPPIDINPEDWAIVKDILRRHVPDRDVLAFGSRARHTARRYSDLDIAIIGETALPSDVRWSLSEALVESDLPFKVDVLEWATTSESFRNIVLRHAVPIQSAAPKGDGTGGPGDG
jgi:type I restriction enzyme S subunit